MFPQIFLFSDNGRDLSELVLELSGVYSEEPEDLPSTLAFIIEELEFFGLHAAAEDLGDIRSDLIDALDEASTVCEYGAYFWTSESESEIEKLKEDAVRRCTRISDLIRASFFGHEYCAPVDETKQTLVEKVA